LTNYLHSHTSSGAPSVRNGVLVTGCAGFIGFHLALRLLSAGETVIGLDNLNTYYDVNLKKARLAQLRVTPHFIFLQNDLADRKAVAATFNFGNFDRIVHLAAQVGVRHSLVDPFSYVSCNVLGFLALLEEARQRGNIRHIVYASSSSVYGGTRGQAMSVNQPTDSPLSIYAATKKMDELMSYSYAQLFDIRLTGLRLFNVYGPWGRPDMAVYLFTKAILTGQPIRLFNRGDLWRDFTYIDDTVSGIIAALAREPEGTPPHAIYNLGNNQSQEVRQFLAILEGIIGRRALIIEEEMQPGDMPRTCADIAESRRDLGFAPVTTLEVGLRRFVEWYRKYHNSMG
jgi:UDP-glucuronate 4-epimerase